VSALLKWWLGCRYRGYRKTVQKCTCGTENNRPTVSLKHILECDRFKPAILKASTVAQVPKGLAIALLTNHPFENWKEWRDQNLL